MTELVTGTYTSENRISTNFDIIEHDTAYAINFDDIKSLESLDNTFRHLKTFYKYPIQIVGKGVILTKTSLPNTIIQQLLVNTANISVTAKIRGDWTNNEEMDVTIPLPGTWKILPDFENPLQITRKGGKSKRRRSRKHKKTHRK